MSYVPILNDVLEVRAYCFQNAQLGVNTTHWKVSATPGPGLNQSSMANRFHLLLGTLYAANMNTTQASFLGISIQKVRPLPKPPTELSTSAAIPGADAGDPLPSQVRGLIALFGSGAGPSGRGRQYIPFFTVTFNSPTGHPTGAARGNMDLIKNILTAQQTLTVGLFSTVVDPVLFNRTTGVTTAIIGGSSRARWATQKRSGDYGRQNQSPF